MEHNKINFDARSEETQDILKNISGVGLKWGIYSFVFIFIVVVTLSSQIKFSSSQLVNATKISDKEIQLDNSHQFQGMSTDFVESIIIGQDTMSCNLKINDNNTVNVLLEESLPSNLDKELSGLELLSKLNIIQIIFST